MMIRQLLSAAVAIGCIYGAQTANADSVLDWDSSEWRLEFSGLAGLGTGSDSRTGDFNANIVAEYEVPWAGDSGFQRRGSLGFRLRPLFYYNQDDGGDDHIYGASAGFAFRIYQNPDTRTGIFGEIAEEFLLQSDKFEGISTHFNFMSQFGLGYQSEKDWFIGVRYTHMSNAGLGNENSGVDMVGVFGGFTF